MSETPESEITRILSSWPAESRADGVLRVVRAMQERIDGALCQESVAVEAVRNYSHHLALADAAMPIIRPEGFVQFGPNCAIHVDKIASTASPVVRNAFLAWMESVEQYHAARASAARPEPDREERADAGPHVVHLQGHGESETVENVTVVNGPCTMFPAEEGVGPHPPARPSLKFGREEAELLKSLHDGVPDDPDEPIMPMPPAHKQNWRGVCPACRREVIMEVESYANPEVKP